ncbi:DUF3592 domain-containing protein [Massilia antarctica]|uniref:DUF3592 domain-containing protein n=1 Tax=Massilia antarctica TaxID=2765360 RepID=UPI0006BB598C|nr:DUF3592 domain-containing protein [Massilia sp. H27-R4]MCY0912225.1 DUF3592 domain-containing protein [Massilia sp. H27-R4]
MTLQLLAACVTAALAAAATLTFLMRLRHSLQARSWPSASAVILTSAAEELEAEGAARAAITYRYTVDGCDYVGTRLAFTGIMDNKTRASAERAIAKYPPGATVPAYYCPRQPADAVLERGINPAVTRMFVFSIFIVAVTWIRYLHLL